MSFGGCRWLPVIAVMLAGGGRELMAQGGAPGIDTVKQTLDRRWQQLKPQDATERNALFQEARANGGGAGSYLFQVSATIRDYSPGYPRNRYYGQTCVAHMQGVYKVWADSTGKWQVDGRMTPDLSARQCKPNPSEGVSSIPAQGCRARRRRPGRAADWHRDRMNVGPTGRPGRC